MTTLDDYEVYRSKEYVVFKHIAGDLSFTFDVVPKERAFSSDGGRGVGTAVRSLSEAKQFIKTANKIGYEKADAQTRKGYYAPGHTFGYLPEDEARKYIGYEGAYGEYRDRLRNKFLKKETKPDFMNKNEWNKIVDKNVPVKEHRRGFRNNPYVPKNDRTVVEVSPGHFRRKGVSQAEVDKDYQSY